MSCFLVCACIHHLGLVGTRRLSCPGVLDFITIHQSGQEAGPKVLLMLTVQFEDGLVLALVDAGKSLNDVCEGSGLHIHMHMLLSFPCFCTSVTLIGSGRNEETESRLECFILYQGKTEQLSMCSSHISLSHTFCYCSSLLLTETQILLIQ